MKQLQGVHVTHRTFPNLYLLKIDWIVRNVSMYFDRNGIHSRLKQPTKGEKQLLHPNLTFGAVLRWKTGSRSHL